MHSSQVVLLVSQAVQVGRMGVALAKEVSSGLSLLLSNFVRPIRKGPTKD